MPIYEYVCAGCGAGFERRLKVVERSGPQACPSCGAERGVLRMSAPSLV
ncbi:MAG: FmdB family zinc ribbon protein, partial [Longimicrobiales bacterium]